MRRHARIRFVNASTALVNGHGTREAIRDLARSAPVWATLSRGWVVQPHRARQLIALLEHRGYDITIETDDEADDGRWEEPATDTAVSAPAESPDPGAGLW